MLTQTTKITMYCNVLLKQVIPTINSVNLKSNRE